MTVAEAVRKARQARGWSQLDLALAADTTQNWVWRVESGTIPSANMLARLADALDLELRFGEYCIQRVEPARLAS